MQRLQAYKFLLKPTGQQKRQMSRFAGSCRFVYNKALKVQQTNDAAGGKFIGFVEMVKHLTPWRNDPETAWLAQCPYHALQHALKDLDQAYKRFFNKQASFPVPKKRGPKDSFRYPDKDQIKLEQHNNRIRLPKLGWVRYKNSRTVLGEVRNATVSFSAGRWYVSIQTEREVDTPVPSACKAVGIDVGVTSFAALSDGHFLAAKDSFKKHEARLRRYQRSMSRKQKHSNNWKKARCKVQRLHVRIANVRRDYLHQASATISRQHALVCVEDLQVRNMSRSASGTVEQPGRNVKAKSGLNKSILDQGWYEFRRQLEYKLDWNGGLLQAVPPHNTSRTCPLCGHVSKDNRKTQAKFECVQCGYRNHADTVAAINILARGLDRLKQDEGQDMADASVRYESTARIVCGEDVRQAAPARARRAASTKQEPTEVTTREVTHA